MDATADDQSRDRTGPDRSRFERSTRCWAHCPSAYTTPQGLVDKLRRSSAGCRGPPPRSDCRAPYSVPVGGDGGVRNPNLPPPSRPEDNDYRRHSGAPAGHSVSRMERVDEELPAATMSRCSSTLVMPRHRRIEGGVRRPSEVVRRTHPPRDDQPTRRRLRPGRRRSTSATTSICAPARPPNRGCSARCCPVAETSAQHCCWTAVRRWECTAGGSSDSNSRVLTHCRER